MVPPTSHSFSARWKPIGWAIVEVSFGGLGTLVSLFSFSGAGESCVTSFAWITLRFSCPVVSVLWLPPPTHWKRATRSNWNTWNHLKSPEITTTTVSTCLCGWLVGGGVTEFWELHPFLHNCHRDSQSPVFLALAGFLFSFSLSLFFFLFFAFWYGK